MFECVRACVCARACAWRVDWGFPEGSGAASLSIQTIPWLRYIRGCGTARPYRGCSTDRPYRGCGTARPYRGCGTARTYRGLYQPRHRVIYRPCHGLPNQSAVGPYFMTAVPRTASSGRRHRDGALMHIITPQEYQLTDNNQHTDKSQKRPLAAENSWHSPRATSDHGRSSRTRIATMHLAMHLALPVHRDARRRPPRPSRHQSESARVGPNPSQSESAPIRVRRCAAAAGGSALRPTVPDVRGARARARGTHAHVHKSRWNCNLRLRKGLRGGGRGEGRGRHGD